MKLYLREPDGKRPSFALERDDGSLVRGLIGTTYLGDGRIQWRTLHEMFEGPGEAIIVPADGKLPGEA